MSPYCPHHLDRTAGTSSWTLGPKGKRGDRKTEATEAGSGAGRCTIGEKGGGVSRLNKELEGGGFGAPPREPTSKLPAPLLQLGRAPQLETGRPTSFGGAGGT